MLRITTLGASAFALMTASAFAQEAQEIQPEILEAPSGTIAEPDVARTVNILDASQVTKRADAELLAKSEFKQADLNSDGAIDEGEFVAYATIKAPLSPAVATTEAAAETGQTPGVKTTAKAETAEEQFAELSKGDQAISESEMIEARVQQFDEADANDDETLDSEERIQFASLTEVKTSSDSM